MVQKARYLSNLTSEAITPSMDRHLDQLELEGLIISVRFPDA